MKKQLKENLVMLKNLLEGTSVSRQHEAGDFKTRGVEKENSYG